MKYKEIVVILFFTLVSLFMYAIFPVENSFQQVVVMLFFFVVFPLLFNKLFLKRKVESYGLQIGDWKKGLLWTFYSLILIGLIFFVSLNYFSFLKNYSVPSYVVNNFGNFILYEFTLVVLFVAIYEFYFRGFILFVFESNIKHWTILAQAILFLILVLIIGGESIYQFFPYLVFAPFAGVVAYKSRSIIYSSIAQFIIIFVLDALIIKTLS